MKRLRIIASRGELAAMFLPRGVPLALAGVSCGLAGVAVVTQLMASLLFGTRPLDAGVYALVALGLVSITTLASYLPARAAARVDPLRVLRGE